MAAWCQSTSMSSMAPRGTKRKSIKTGSPPTVSKEVLYQNVKGILDSKSDMDLECFNKGMLRWSLHKKVQNSPGSSLSLVQVLINELAKAEELDSRQNLIPLLHTLMYAIIQTAYIPDELYKQVYNCCKRLLTYPNPYCNVGYGYTKQIKSERSAPGLLYQRMLTAEQRIKNDHYPFQEKVFVLADPDVFHGSLGEFLLADTEGYGSPGLVDHMCNVVQHSIQAALGAKQCQGPHLAEALKGMGQGIQPYFQSVLRLLEQCVENGRRGESGALRERLQQLYCEIIGATDSEPLSGGSLSNCLLPNPEMSFYLLKDFDIGKELSSWLLRGSSSQEQEDPLLGESPVDMLATDVTRLSVMSNDSGIERDLPPSTDNPSSLENASMSASWERTKSETSPYPCELESSRLSRRGGIKVRLSEKDGMTLMQESFDDPTILGGGGSGERGEARGATLQRRAGSNTMQSPFPKQQRLFIAKIVAMGDDRLLGHLAKQYYLYKKAEYRRLSLTMKVNIQFYYIPVSSASTPMSSAKETFINSIGNPCTLGSYLSMVDPWYKTNIKSLGSMIPKLAEPQANPGTSQGPFVSDVISYYIRTGQQPVYFAIYSVKITSTKITNPVEDVFLTHLEIDFSDVRWKADRTASDKQKKNQGELSGALVLINYRKVTLSGRDVDISTSIRTSSALINAIPSCKEEDLDCLTLTLTRPKSNIVESKVWTSNIKMETLESRPFVVTLDGDRDRTYKDVQSMEIARCRDPLFGAHKTIRSKFNVGEDKDACLNKYMNKDLSLPINTFAGIV